MIWAVLLVVLSLALLAEVVIWGPRRVELAAWEREAKAWLRLRRKGPRG